MSRGVVAGGHPATAEAGAWALREGGNAVDAAIAAVVASLSAESPLTGLGAGGFMLVHRPGTEPQLLDFFVAAGGLGGGERWAELDPVTIDFGDTTQVFNVGVASCGVPGVPSGLAAAAEQFGSMPLADLVVPGVALAREGIEVNQQQSYLFELLEPILAREPEGAAVYAPEGRMLGLGEIVRFLSSPRRSSGSVPTARTPSIAATSPLRSPPRSRVRVEPSAPRIWPATRPSAGSRSGLNSPAARSSRTRRRPRAGS